MQVVREFFCKCKFKEFEAIFISLHELTDEIF